MIFRGLETLIRDLRYGLRQLRRSPGFALVAIATLALGIGANTAIFTLVHAVLLQPLPVEHPDELYSLGDTTVCCDTTDHQENFALYSYALYKDVREQAHEFGEVAAFQSWLTNVSVRRSGARTPTEAYKGQFVSGNYFSALGVRATAGRTLLSADEQLNAAPVAVMSFRAWKQRFAQDPTIIGAVFVVNGLPVTIVGVAAPGFFGDTLRSDPPSFWLPLTLEPALDRDNPLLNQPGEFWLYAAGRLQPGHEPAQVEARLLPEIKQWVTEHTVQRRDLVAKTKLRVLPFANGVGRVRNIYGDGLRLLSCITALVLLIACGNIANLLLARSAASRVQASVRSALGASRGRILAQMITEGVILAMLGGLAGIALAFAGTRLLITLAFRGADYVPIAATPSLPVIAFAVLLSLFTGVVFSLVPAWLVSRTHPIEAMRGAGRSTRDHAALPQKSLLALQAALSLVLLTGAALLGQSLRNLERQPFGFQTRGRMIVRVNPALAGYRPEQLPALYRTLKDRFSRLPGVTRASLALHSPMDGWNWNAPVFIGGRAPSDNPDLDDAQYNFVSADYFETIGTRVISGRPIEEQDQPNTRHVCVVNQAFVRKFFATDNPLGRHLGLNGVSHSGDYEIVGVVEDAPYRDPKKPADPMFFMPLLQVVKYEQPSDNAYQTWGNYIDGVQLQLSAMPGGDFDQLVRRTLAEIDPNLPVLRLTTFDGQISSSFNSPRLIAQLTTLYGILALLLAVVGLYGVASYMVTRRVGEIGIRMAVGARRGALMAMVLRASLKPIGLGLGIGVAVVLELGHAIASQLYGIRSYDPLTLFAAVAVLSFAAIAAALIPARRATTIDPIRALRTD